MCYNILTIWKNKHILNINAKNNLGDYMRKFKLLYFIACFAAILSVTCSYYNGKINSLKTNSYSGYTLRIKNNTVCLFKGDEIIEQYDTIDYTSLPLTDIDNLKSGIKVESIEKVYELIEDFDG